ncbi:unnamed protein product [marine sediment metagenome]|uniref:Fibronectin type-III domain-containing protein n=1 Tax=marine sediment metagenome TaxID=412755 RepID=X1L331_9ZZZZ
MNKKQKRTLKSTVAVVLVLFTLILATFLIIRPFALPSNGITLTLQPIVPRIDPDGSVDLVWNSVGDSYSIYMKENDGSWKKIGSTTGLTFTKTGLADGIYEFKILAYIVTSFFAESNIEVVTVRITAPDSPVLETIESPNTNGVISLEWDVVPNTLYYEVYKSIDR